MNIWGMQRSKKRMTQSLKFEESKKFQDFKTGAKCARLRIAIRRASKQIKEMKALKIKKKKVRS